MIILMLVPLSGGDDDDSNDDGFAMAGTGQDWMKAQSQKSLVLTQKAKLLEYWSWYHIYVYTDIRCSELLHCCRKMAKQSSEEIDSEGLNIELKSLHDFEEELELDLIVDFFNTWRWF